MIRNYYFMRHGESSYNTLGLCNDDPSIIVPLTRLGREQVTRAAAALQEKQIDLVCSSSLPRAVETATLANAQHDAPMRVDPRLNDRRTGFEGRKVSDYLQARDDDPENFCVEGGESYPQLKARTLSFIADLKAMPQQNVLVVSHHEVLQVIYGFFHGLDDTSTRKVWLENASVFSVSID